MLTARHPFAGARYESVLGHIMHHAPPPASHWNPAVPDALSGVVARMLERDPEKRFATCDEVATALARARTGKSVAPAAVTVPVRARPLARPTTVALAVIAIAVATLVTWMAFRPPALPHDRLVAIVPPFATKTPQDFEAFTLGLLDLLSTRLRMFQFERGFQWIPFTEAYAQQPGSATEARALLGANLVLVPKLEPRGNLLHGRLELRETVQGHLLGARQFQVAAADPPGCEDSLVSASLSLLHLPRRAREARNAISVRGAGTFRYLAQGIGRLCAEDSKEVRERARADLEAACRAEPESSVPHVWLANAELRIWEDRPEASWLEHVETTARDAVALDSAYAYGHHVLGNVLKARKRDREALAEFRRAVDRDPTRDDTWRNYGLCHRRLGNPQGEHAVYESAIALRPGAYRPRWWLADWEFEQGHIDAAIQGYREVVARAPALASGYATLGGMLMAQGEYGRAIDTLKLAVALRPSATAYTNLGSAYFNTGQGAAAVDAYNQALQFGEANYALWQNLGDAYYWLRGSAAQARGAYEQAARLGRQQLASIADRILPPGVMLEANLACVYSKLGYPDSARALLAAALASDSANVMVQYSAALAHWDLHERSEALDWLERAIAGGYPLKSIRGSPVHRDWQSEPRFNALLASSTTTSLTHPPH